MGWTVPTYDATRGTGDPAKWATAQFELCRAVNERQAATAVTKTTFYNAAGALAADRVIGDFDGMRITGTNSYVYLNLTKIRDAILAMIATGYYTDTAGGTVWTKAALETAIGYDIDAAPSNIQDARFCQAMQDALDALIYVTREVNSGNKYGQDAYESDVYGTLEEAWDNRRDNIDAGPTGHVYWSSTASTYVVAISPTATFDFVVPAWTGTVSGGAYKVATVNETGTSINWSFGGMSESIAGSTALTNTWHEWSAPELPLNATTARILQITTSEPADTPFTGSNQIVSMTGDGDDAFGRNALARLYIDLSSALADQT